jgi:uncharacterized protein
MNLTAPPAKSPRLEGPDVARALAILGMMTVHFMLVMTDGVPTERWSDFLLGLLDGRAAATFVILAGMGVTFLARKAGGSAEAPERKRVAAILRRRGLLLLVLGLLNLTIWEGDILRVYGVSLLLAPWLVWQDSRTVLLAALGFGLTFGVLFFMLDYGRNWDWNTMTYHGLWTVTGLVRNLFFDGFRSVFPWTGLLLFGVWLGRLDWSTAAVPRRVMLGGAALLVFSTAMSRLLRLWLGAHPQPGLGPEEVAACFGLQSMPPLPLFLLNATGFALVVVGACTLGAARWRDRWPVRALATTGRLAFTWYVAHILLGLGGVIVLGWTGTSHRRALLTALAFFAMAVVVSLAWRRRFANGPMESVLRRVGQG